MTDTITFKANYMPLAMNPFDMVETAQERLEKVKFDTFVATGLSGTIVAPVLAHAMGKTFVIVRKPNDGSHQSYPLFGELGHRWVFLDDFICSGRTYKFVRDAIDNEREARKYSTGKPFSIRHVGVYEYENYSYYRAGDRDLKDKMDKAFR